MALHEETQQKELQSRLGENLRKLRDERGMSAAALGNAAGLSQNYIYDIEAGRWNPTVAKMRSIAVVLGVSIDVLMGDMTVAEYDMIQAVRRAKQ